MPDYGGINYTTAPIRNLLANKGILDPYTNAPFTEAMLLGIGGGLGAGYILWEFKGRGSPNIVMGFINRWNYTLEYINNLLNRIGGTATVVEFSGRKKASDALIELVQKSPVIAWTDKAHLPHWQLPDALKGHIVHLVGVYRANDTTVTLDDFAKNPFDVSADLFALSRERIVSNKSRLLTVTTPRQIDLAKAIREGINDQIEHLSRDSESFSLPVYKKWAKMLTDNKNKKSWKVTFASRIGLYDALTSIYEGVVLDGSDGAGLRNLYADFLIEAAHVLEKPEMELAAKAYRQTATAWRAFADVALPREEFNRTRELLHLRYDLLRKNDLSEAQLANDEWQEARVKYNVNFPLDERTVDAIFVEMGHTLETIYDLEVKALNILKDAML